MHKIILIPGLGDEATYTRFGTRWWKTRGLDVVVFPVGWRDGDKHFAPKLQRILKLVDEMVKNGDTVSLIGLSAGGSAVLNVFGERKQVIHKVVTIGARNRVGVYRGANSFENRTHTSPAFAESIECAETIEKEFNVEDRKKIMTIRPVYDEIVPARTVVIRGAKNVMLPTVEHLNSIISSLTIYSHVIRSFLR